MITRRTALGAAALAPWLAAPAAAGVARPSSLEELTRPAVNRGAALSRDGKRIALLHEVNESGRRAAYVSLISADNFDAPATRVIIGNYDVEDVRWANDDRLLISVLMKREEDYVPTGTRFGMTFNTSVRRMLSVGLDGSPPAMMFGDRAFLKTNFNLSQIVDMLPDDPQRILMQAWEPQGLSKALYSVDVYTGAAALVERGGPATDTWSVQDGKPVLRWDYNDRGTAGSLLGRPPGETNWKVLRKIARYDGFNRPDFDIVGFTEAAGVFLAVARAEGEDMASLRPFDIRDMSFGEAVAQREDRDIESALVDEHGRYVAAISTDDRVVYDFADKALNAHFRGIDSFFDKTCNVRIYGMNRDRTRFLAFVSGPRLPGAYYFYDLPGRRLEPVAISRPWLKEESLAPVEMLDVRTRDGATFRAYLTVPLASGPRPLVVMPHGGPVARDRQDFDLFAQAFAAQGWLVLQPNFRGSGGYGQAFAEAGHGRWGDRMQEDVEDAVAQVLASGRADPDRVAICGASYGGYAALMGAVRRPDLYRAVVSIAGVSDLPEILASQRRDGADSPYYQLWVRRIGDPEADAEKLAAWSPRRRAKEFRAPVLLVHGLEDQVVSADQSKAMASALRSAGKAVQLVTLREAGHGYWEPKVERQVLETSVAFIAKAFA
ncbi:MAG: alpha/beta hydrolase family protein [Phenylobacterium sp.]|uniref:alpha/beta hydrolase family protein n=1 Tax=Phenylobacterium sp. TaxID=1871053 RepID=UPI00391C057E